MKTIVLNNDTLAKRPVIRLRFPYDFVLKEDCIIAHHYSVSFQSQVINAVKLFFHKRQNRKLNPELVYRPKKPRLLPNVLGKEEVKQILEAHKNIKHRAMLSLINACGLRRSELLNLKILDVDSKRGAFDHPAGQG